VKAALGSADVLASWAVSDHANYPAGVPRLLHGGPGLLTVGNLRKPRYWALRMLNRLGPARLACRVAGDGAEGLVDALVTRDEDGRVDILVWNGAPSGESGPRLDRRVVVRIEGLPPATYDVLEERLDEIYGDVMGAWEQLGSPDWPDSAGWQALRAADAPSRWLTGTADLPDGYVEHLFDLPMPGVRLVSLRPR
jgi:xylan 1,4-beta-xylosidase